MISSSSRMRITTSQASTRTTLTASNQGIYYGDWNIRIKVEEQRFYIHKYVVEKFNGLQGKIAQVESQGQDSITLPGNPADFENTFRLLYATLYNPIEHGPSVLASALRLATKFDHRDLRAFAIQNISLEALDRMDLVKLIRDIDTADWQAKALAYLSSHPEQIKLEEARILGMELVVQVITQRENKLPLRVPVPSRPTNAPSSEVHSPRLKTERRSTNRTQKNEESLSPWAQFVRDVQEKTKNSRVNKGGEQAEEPQPRRYTAARGLILKRGRDKAWDSEPLPVDEQLSNRQKRHRLSL